MIFRYPDQFIVPVKEIKVKSIRNDIGFKNIERNRTNEILQDLILEFKNNKKIWCDIDNYYCDYEAGYI